MFSASIEAAGWRWVGRLLLDRYNHLLLLVPFPRCVPSCSTPAFVFDPLSKSRKLVCFFFTTNLCSFYNCSCRWSNGIRLARFVGIRPDEVLKSRQLIRCFISFWSLGGCIGVSKSAPPKTIELSNQKIRRKTTNLHISRHFLSVTCNAWSTNAGFQHNRAIKKQLSSFYCLAKL